MNLPGSVIIEVSGMHSSGGLDGSVFNGIHELPFVYDVKVPFRNVLYYLLVKMPYSNYKYSFFARPTTSCDFSITTWQQWFRTGSISGKGFIKDLVFTNNLVYGGAATIISMAMSPPVINPSPVNTEVKVIINLNQLSWEVDE